VLVGTFPQMGSCVPLLQRILNDSEPDVLAISGFDLNRRVKSVEYRPLRSAMGRNADGAGLGLALVSV
jgi:hypothetical protein